MDQCTDLNYLNGLTKSNPTLMLEMISLYLQQTPLLVTAMKNSVNEADWDGLYASVHQMIPSFVIMGISNELEHTARKVQELARQQQPSELISVLVLQLTQVCTQSCIELSEAYNLIKSSQLQ